MPRKSVVYMGIDPGIANTGVVICTRSKGNAFKLVYAEKITTKKEDTARIDSIRARLRQLAVDYHVDRVICEAFETRPWEKNKSYSVAMCKVINALSEEFYSLAIPFMLSSPANKKGIHFENLPESVQAEILSRPKTHQEHITDAYIHVYYQVTKRGN